MCLLKIFLLLSYIYPPQSLPPTPPHPSTFIFMSFTNYNSLSPVSAASMRVGNGGHPMEHGHLIRGSLLRKLTLPSPLAFSYQQLFSECGEGHLHLHSTVIWLTLVLVTPADVGSRVWQMCRVQETVLYGTVPHPPDLILPNFPSTLFPSFDRQGVVLVLIKVVRSIQG